MVIPGSHRMDVGTHELAELVAADPSLLHQVIAPPGSTLLFGETLVHCTGPLTSDRERAIITTGYGPTMFPYWCAVADDVSGVISNDTPDAAPLLLLLYCRGALSRSSHKIAYRPWSGTHKLE